MAQLSRIPDEARGYDCEFVKKPEKIQTDCPICLLVLRKPNQLRCCGYVFCQSCISKALRYQNAACPMCQGRNPAMFPDRNMERLLSGYKVYCIHRAKRETGEGRIGRRRKGIKQWKGCEWEGELGELEKHLNENPSGNNRMDGCSYVEINCKFCDDFFRRASIQKHQLFHCPKRQHTCPHCQYSNTYIEITENHMPICPFFPMECPHCKKIFKRSKFEHHVHSECLLAPIICNFHLAGCQVRLPRARMKDHINNNGVHHAKLFVEYAKDHGDGTLDKCLPMITSCVDTLTELTHENEIEATQCIAYMNDLFTWKAKCMKILALYESILEFIKEKESQNNAQKEKISTLEKSNKFYKNIALVLVMLFSLLVVVIIVSQY